MKYWESEPFKALQKSWYKRLEEHGFRDAEKLIGAEMELRQSAAHPLRHVKDNDVREIYYTLIGQNIHEEKNFRDEVDQTIMTLYAEGKIIKEIRDALDKAGVSRCRHTIRYIIRRYEMKWGMQVYTSRQIRLKIV